ncbi:MAG: hypothetical protein KDD04_10200 [Sinomicrobium sp.]|nr:hypothetical protein [Sinomicrobium sp.]
MALITKIDDRNLRVNGKLVYRDMDGNWKSRVELTAAEQEALNNYVKD